MLHLAVWQQTNNDDAFVQHTEMAVTRSQLQIILERVCETFLCSDLWFQVRETEQVAILLGKVVNIGFSSTEKSII